MLSGVRCTFFPAARGFVFSVFDSAAQRFTLVFWWRKRGGSENSMLSGVRCTFFPAARGFVFSFFYSAARGLTLVFWVEREGRKRKRHDAPCCSPFGVPFFSAARAVRSFVFSTHFFKLRCSPKRNPKPYYKLSENWASQFTLGRSFYF